MKDQPQVLGTMSQEDPLYTDLDTLFTQEAKVGKNARQESIAFYNGLADSYNAASVPGIVVTELPRTKNRVGNLANVLENRGLVRGLDFYIAAIRKDADGKPHPVQERKVAIKRLTAATMTKCIAG